MFRVVILGHGDMLSNLIIGATDAKCKIVGVFRYERAKNGTVYQKLKDFLLPSKEYSYMKSYNLPEIKAKKANSQAFKKELLRLNPDIVLVGTWSEKLKKDIIQLPKIAMINAHPSLLPKYRGPNPYLQTILHGEEKSGLTFHLMSEEFDSGPVLLQKSIEIMPDDTGKELRERTVLAARSAVTELLNMLADDFIIPVDQSEDRATYFPDYIHGNNAGYAKIAEAVYEYPSLQFGQILYMLDIVDDDYHLGMPTMEYVDRVNTRVFDKGSERC